MDSYTKHLDILYADGTLQSLRGVNILQFVAVGRERVSLDKELYATKESALELNMKRPT